MNLNSQITFFNYLYDLNNIPLCVFQDDEILLQLPRIIDFSQRIRRYYEPLRVKNNKITYFISSYEALYGLVRIEENDLWVFAGPYFTLPVTKESLPIIMNEIQLPQEAVSDAKIFLSSVPTGPLHRFLSYLSCIRTALCQDLIPVEDIICDNTFRKTNENILQQYADNSYSEVTTAKRHGTFLHEMHRLDLISQGNVEAMKANTISMLPGEQGHIGHDALRQAKNIFIAGCTLYTRAAIAGGLDVEEAYNLSDLYIQTCEKYTNVADVERLHKRMPLDFTERVEKEVKLKNVSQPIIDAVHFIQENVNQPLQSADIAAHVNLSNSYFLKRFKNETGIGVTDYIMNVKIDAACMLLSYSDKTLTEISNYLYFSSQSYFQNVFKKIKGITPLQYRNSKKTPIFMQDIQS